MKKKRERGKIDEGGERRRGGRVESGKGNEEEEREKEV